MKTSLLSILIIYFADTLSAQKSYTIYGTPLLSGQDTVIQKLKDDLKKNELPYNGIPNSLTIKRLPPVFIGNNGKGFDIYESRVDNMAILKPDNGFASNMPVDKMYRGNNQTDAPGLTIQGNRLSEILKNQKRVDLLFMNPIQPQNRPYVKKNKYPFSPKQ